MNEQVQKSFRDFHDTIKIKDLDREEESNKILREKRDVLLKDIKSYFDKKNKDLDPVDHIKFKWFNQGSYAMYTGVKLLMMVTLISMLLLFLILIERIIRILQL